MARRLNAERQIHNAPGFKINGAAQIPCPDIILKQSYESFIPRVKVHRKGPLRRMLRQAKQGTSSIMNHNEKKHKGGLQHRGRVSHSSHPHTYRFPTVLYAPAN